MKKHLDSSNNIEEQIVDQQSEGIQFDANGKPIEKKMKASSSVDPTVEKKPLFDLKIDEYKKK